MATLSQLRDAQTGECIAEGPPEAMVLLAQNIGTSEVMFDGVGLAFNPDNTLTRYQEHLQVARDHEASAPQNERAEAKRRVDKLVALDTTARELRIAAKDALREARKRAHKEP